MVIEVVVAEADRDLNLKLSEAIERDNNLALIGKALTGLETISFVMRQQPDVLVISTKMPDLDLIGIIKRIMRQYPTPMLILHSRDDGKILEKVRKLDIGIIDFLEMSGSGNQLYINDVSLTTRIHILAKLNIEKFKLQIEQGISQTQARQSKKSKYEKIKSTKNYETKSIETNSVPVTRSYSGSGRSSKIIIIGSSTGGPRLLSEVIPKFPKNLPPVVIVQHMPVGFISAFAKRLNRLSQIRVKEATSSQNIMPGTVYLAPGGKHLEIHRPKNGMAKIILTDGPAVNFVKPAVDVTLKSAAKTYGSGVISVILTGMGSDGRDGSKAVKDVGGIVLALNEEDSDIYGMNRSVIEAGLSDDVVSKRDIVPGIIRAIEGRLF